MDKSVMLDKSSKTQHVRGNDCMSDQMPWSTTWDENSLLTFVDRLPAGSDHDWLWTLVATSQVQNQSPLPRPLSVSLDK